MGELSRPRLNLSMAADGVGLVEIDSPPINALDLELYGEISMLVNTLEAMSEIRVVVFASKHPTIFVAGADLKKTQATGFTRAATSERLDRANLAFLRLQRLGKPTVAAIDGHALGGGCEFLLSMDFRFMRRGAPRIGLPEAALGLLPGAGGTQRLARLVGRMRAADLMMLARRIDADEAERIGLVTSACDDARSAAFAYAQRLALMPSSSIRWIKTCLNDGYDGDLPRGLAVERIAALETFTAAEAAEGVEAFLEKRPPRFHEA